VKALYNARYNVEKLESGCDNLKNLSAAGWDSYEQLEGMYM